MNYKYSQIDKAVPEVGDLIRNLDTYNFINLVVAVGPPRVAGRAEIYSSKVDSVRYADIKQQHRLLLNGRRSRPFEWPISEHHGKWHRVEEIELRPVDNAVELKAILDSLPAVEDLRYQGGN